MSGVLVHGYTTEVTTTPAASFTDESLSRYSRQMLFAPVGEAGQKRLKYSRVALVGCGALGSVLANTLARAGVGYLRIIDRDFIELNNLQRQVLFDEHDLAQNLPKAEAAARKLRKINSAVEVDGVIADLRPENAEALLTDVDLLLDGTDNFETRFLVNDVAVKHGLPWVYGAVLGSEGVVMPVLPGETACLRCVWEEMPPPGTTPTCDTAGVLAPAVEVVASLQAVEAMKILMGRIAEVSRALVSIDVWRGQFRSLGMQAALEQGTCACCRRREFEFLEGKHASASTTLCGRDAVQVTPAAGARVNFQEIAARVGGRARPASNAFLLRFTIDAYQVTLFADGRAIIKGTSDPAAARSVYAKYIGA